MDSLSQMDDDTLPGVLSNYEVQRWSVRTTAKVVVISHATSKCYNKES